LLGLVANRTELGLHLFLDRQVHLALGVVELALLFDQVGLGLLGFGQLGVALLQYLVQFGDLLDLGLNVDGNQAFRLLGLGRCDAAAVSAGGTASDFAVSSGGTANVLGTVTSDVAVDAGGVENVSSGGLISGAPGSETYISGGTVNVFSGGSAAHVIVSSGGTLDLSAGATADHLTVSSGGTANVLGTVTSNVAVDAGGVENVSSGGLISGAPGSGTVISGGVVNVFSGGSAAYLGVSSGGTLNVSAGGTASDFAVSSGGTAIVLGTVTSETINGGHFGGGGSEIVLSGGVSISGIVNSGASQTCRRAAR
jgi:autotransporter passenger strand-loop-strand repeat protein